MGIWQKLREKLHPSVFTSLPVGYDVFLTWLYHDDESYPRIETLSVRGGSVYAVYGDDSIDLGGVDVFLFNFADMIRAVNNELTPAERAFLVARVSEALGVVVGVGYEC